MEDNTEVTATIEFTGSRLVMHELVSSGAIYLHPSLEGKTPRSWLFYPEDKKFEGEKSYVVDMDKAVAVLETIEDIQEPSLEDYKNREQEIFEVAKSAFKRVVRAFVSNGDIPVALAVEVGRLLRPGNIMVTHEDFGRFLYLKDTFPENPNERAQLEIGVRYIFSQIDDYRQVLVQNGAYLSEEQLIEFILRGLISHEYGHAVDRTMELAQIPEGEELKISEYYSFRKKMHQEIFDTIAPNQDLAEVLAPEPDGDDAYYTKRESTSSERVGRGFQYLGMKYALLELGIGGEKANSVFQGFIKIEDSKPNQYKKLASEIRAKGLNLELFCHGINDAVLGLREIGRADLEKKIQDLDKPDARQFGYYYPLTREQIQAYISAFWSPKALVENLA